MSGVELNSIRDAWYQNLEKFPRKVAVVDGERRLTYAECDLLTDRLRRELAQRFSFRPGDRAAIAARNCLEYFLTYWAVVKSGGIAVPVNVRLGAEELHHVLARSEPVVLIVQKFCWRAVDEALSNARPQVVGIDFADQGVAPFEELVAVGGTYDFQPDIGRDALAIIMHTSGTTGRPKGAMMRHGDLLFNNRLAVYAHGLRHEDVHLLVVPMFHATALYSLLPTSALLGSTIVLAARSDPVFLLSLIQEQSITTFFGVPMMFRLLGSVPDVTGYDLGSLRLIAYAGSPMAPGVIRRLREIFPHVTLHNFFGLTETVSMTHVLPSCDAETRPESIGKVLPHVRQCILDDKGHVAAPGEVGKLHLHRSNVICGYWNEPGRLDESIHGDWFDTGDLALVDEDGFVYLKGRSKDMLIVGGENVYSLEVENCIMTHEAVVDVAVVGVPATGIRVHLGELIKAFVVARPGADLTDADVKRHCAGHLATYKVPHIVEFRAELPRNAGGKVLKRELRQMQGTGQPSRRKSDRKPASRKQSGR